MNCIIRILRIVLSCAFLCTFIIACSDEEGLQQGPGPASPYAILSDQTLVVDSATNLKLLSINGDMYTYSFMGTPPVITTGTILLSGKDGGYLRKVLGTSVSGNTIVCETTQATLTEAFEQLHLEETIELTPLGLKSQTPLADGVLLPEITGYKAVDVGLGTFQIAIDDIVVFDANGNEDTTNDQITLSGSIGVSPSLNVDISIDDFELERFLFAVTLGENAQLSATAKVEKTFEKEIELVRYAFTPIVVAVGIVPVTLTPQFVIKLGASWSANGTLTVGITQTASFTAGVQYDTSNGWGPAINSSIDFSFNPPSLTVGASAKAYVSPEIDLLIYSVVGPYVDTEGYLLLEANPAANPWWSLYGGLGIDGGVKFEVFGAELADYSVTILDYRKLLAQAPGVCTDNDRDGHFAESGCGSALDCDDNDANNWISCSSCRDSDNDGSYVACDVFATVGGPDCNDADPNNWTGCESCKDTDHDGYFVGCDRYVEPDLKGPDCDDADPGNWNKCSSCKDVDKDGWYVGCDVLPTDKPIEDCDDNNAWRYPGALEECDGFDNQCRAEDIGFGVVDEGCIQFGAASTISATDFHTCAIVNGGAVSCWGEDDVGELGDGLLGPLQWNDALFSSVPVAAGTITTAKAIDTGPVKSCAVLTDGTAWCWGWNSSWQIGVGDEYYQFDPPHFHVYSSPVQVTGITTAKGIVSSQWHACVKLEDKTLMCWGANGQGYLAQGESSVYDIHDYSTPIAPKADISGSPLSNVIDVAVGGWHTCAVMGTGNVKCWGYNEYGQLGASIPPDNPGYPLSYATLPIDVDVVSQAVAIATGSAHNCVVLTNGMVQCWGLNSMGQLGQDKSIIGWAQQTPQLIPGLGSVIAITAGGNQTCALLSDYTVDCWGDLFGSQPVPFPNGDNCVAVSAGGDHVCVVKADGAIWCLGFNDHGQLGNATTIDSLSVPVRVIGIGP